MYQTKGSQDVSWHQRRPDLSLALIAASDVGKDAGIIDVGGGASTLVDFLLDDGHTRLTARRSAAALMLCDTMNRPFWRNWVRSFSFRRFVERPT